MKQNMYNLSLNDKKKAHTSHRLSRVDVQARQKPPWAKVHRPVRSMTHQAGTGNQANAQNLSYHFTISQLAETKEVNWIWDKTILQMKNCFSASTWTESTFKTYYNCLWMCKMFKCTVKGCQGSYHCDPWVPESEGQHHVSGKCCCHCKQHPIHVPPCLINHEAQNWRCRGWYDVHNTRKDRQWTMNDLCWNII